MLGFDLVSRAANALRDRRVAERQAEAFARRIDRKPVQTQILYDEARSIGTSLTAVAEFEHTRIGVDALGERGKTAEAVGQGAAAKLEAELAAGATTDSHTADNLMVWVALLGGRYTFPESTGHLVTNQWVIEHFLPGVLQIQGNQMIADPRAVRKSG
jgi:RNA 3'-terminal phosphate cyclase